MSFHAGQIWRRHFALFSSSSGSSVTQVFCLTSGKISLTMFQTGRSFIRKHDNKGINDLLSVVWIRLSMCPLNRHQVVGCSLSPHPNTIYLPANTRGGCHSNRICAFNGIAGNPHALPLNQWNVAVALHISWWTWTDESHLQCKFISFFSWSAFAKWFTLLPPGACWRFSLSFHDFL